MELGQFFELWLAGSTGDCSALWAITRTYPPAERAENNKLGLADHVAKATRSAVTASNPKP